MNHTKIKPEMGNIISVLGKLPHNDLVLVALIFQALVSNDIPALQDIRKNAPEVMHKHLDEFIGGAA